MPKYGYITIFSDFWERSYEYPPSFSQSISLYSMTTCITASPKYSEDKNA